MQETKFFMERSVIYDLGQKKAREFPLDYPMFIMFTSEDKERIQRNFLEATINGLSPDFRKMCITSNCNEGFTYKEILDRIQIVPEVSQEEYNMFLEVPHWNPILKLDATLVAYSSSIRAARDLSKDSKEEKQLYDLVEEYIAATTKVTEKSVEILPVGNYSQSNPETSIVNS